VEAWRWAQHWRLCRLVPKSATRVAGCASEPSCHHCVARVLKATCSAVVGVQCLCCAGCCCAAAGQASCPFGDGVLCLADGILASETCEELFTPQVGQRLRIAQLSRVM
jgi:hypothetical protein